MPAYTPAELHTLFRTAFNLCDPDALTALYEPGAVLAVNGQNVSGSENIKEALRKMLRRRGRMTLETRAVIESPQGLAVLHGSWIVEPTAGPGPVTRGLSTEIVRQQPDGTWLVVIDNPYTPERPSVHLG